MEKKSEIKLQELSSFRPFWKSLHHIKKGKKNPFEVKYQLNFNSKRLSALCLSLFCIQFHSIKDFFINKTVGLILKWAPLWNAMWLRTLMIELFFFQAHQKYLGTYLSSCVKCNMVFVMIQQKYCTWSWITARRLFFRIHLFAREVLVMKKLDI